MRRKTKAARVSGFAKKRFFASGGDIFAKKYQGLSIALRVSAGTQEDLSADLLVGGHQNCR